MSLQLGPGGSITGVTITFGDGTSTYNSALGWQGWYLGSFSTGGNSGALAMPRGFWSMHGQLATTYGSSDSFSFPQAFPNACTAINLSIGGLSGVGSPPSFYPFQGVVSATTTGFTVKTYNWENQSLVPGTGINFYYHAVGY
jgi:hypothetical protein